ncbi:MAG: hypothetical protein CVU72_07775 [Deltaproteobacteria bacterium HGW-Deltaproteobacteria-7]|nr:MAG: hypothetical protein CVU72_07775 [Deltaproteobacteria bacterium HGW-Deltaproteobacteria-7]PKN51531.1 MAG: hypothetical protein CVU55_11310 [Deltaproteobacteria bacterium HGW-Deltaproteobacteria-13]
MPGLTRQSSFINSWIPASAGMTIFLMYKNSPDPHGSRALHLSIPYQVRDKLLNSPKICLKKFVIAGLDPAIQDYMY